MPTIVVTTVTEVEHIYNSDTLNLSLLCINESEILAQNLSLVLPHIKNTELYDAVNRCIAAANDAKSLLEIPQRPNENKGFFILRILSGAFTNASLLFCFNDKSRATIVRKHAFKVQTELVRGKNKYCFASFSVNESVNKFTDSCRELEFATGIFL